MDIERLKQLGMVSEEGGLQMSEKGFTKQQDPILELCKALSKYNRPLAIKYWKQHKANVDKNAISADSLDYIDDVQIK